MPLGAARDFVDPSADHATFAFQGLIDRGGSFVCILSQGILCSSCILNRDIGILAVLLVIHRQWHVYGTIVAARRIALSFQAIEDDSR